jgi:hypothetical protein
VGIDDRIDHPLEKISETISNMIGAIRGAEKIKPGAQE